MKLALCTTTIHVPEALRLLRAYGPKVEFFVAGDLKTPHEAVKNLCDEIGRAHYLHPDEQRQWKCSEAIGWNCIQRRNIAFLEALKWGATHIYTWDTDNVPVDGGHFILFEWAFKTFHGPKIVAEWFDPGSLQFPANNVAPVVQRGVPQNQFSLSAIEPAFNSEVGVAQGITLGDPDTSCVDRMSVHPQVHQVSELLRAGIVVSPETRTVFNTQNLVFRRDLAPAMLLAPQFARYDDIIASLICRRIMRERRLHVHYGKPFTYQQRNEHVLLKDLENEMWGMNHIEVIAEWLDRFEFLQTAVSDQVRELYYDMHRAAWCPPNVRALTDAWLEDCAAVL